MLLFNLFILDKKAEPQLEYSKTPVQFLSRKKMKKKKKNQFRSPWLNVHEGSPHSYTISSLLPQPFHPI